MRAVVQRVNRASVTVNQKVISSIDKGLCILVGINAKDTEEDMDYIIKKILNLKLFDKEKPWQANVMDIKGQVLCVSQFTLYALSHKGNKPDFHRGNHVHLSLKS